MTLAVEPPPNVKSNVPRLSLWDHKLLMVAFSTFPKKTKTCPRTGFVCEYFGTDVWAGILAKTSILIIGDFPYAETPFSGPPPYHPSTQQSNAHDMHEEIFPCIKPLFLLKKKTEWANKRCSHATNFLMSTICNLRINEIPFSVVVRNS